MWISFDGLCNSKEKSTDRSHQSCLFLEQYPDRCDLKHSGDHTKDAVDTGSIIVVMLRPLLSVERPAACPCSSATQPEARGV